MAAPPPRILIVDDEPSVLLTLAANLELGGLDVTTAGSGAAALDIVRREAFDLVLTDVRMPGMNGVDLFREIRKTHPLLPVILMTAFAMESLIGEAIREGVFTVLPKSFHVDQLLPMLIAAARTPTALIIDGARDDAKAAAEALGAIGLRVRAVFDEHSAIRAIRDEAVDVCIIELTMASGGDPPLISKLRGLDEALSFIVLSGHDLPELMRKIAVAGPVDWVRKPTGPKELAQSIAAIRGRVVARR